VVCNSAIFESDPTITTQSELDVTITIPEAVYATHCTKILTINGDDLGRVLVETTDFDYDGDGGLTMYLPGTFTISLKYEANVLLSLETISLYIDPCSVTTFIDNTPGFYTTDRFTAYITLLIDYWSNEFSTDTCTK
jgi:hypothetical protein